MDRSKTYEKRLAGVRSFMKERGLDGAMFTSYENRRYYCGFTGSNGYLIVTDYFARSQQEEDAFRQELLRLTQGAPRGACYHFDTPLTVQNETQALHSAGFSSVTLLGHWGATHTLRAEG